MKRKKIRFFFCFRSPYSWIGARWLEERLDPDALGIEYIPFWEPDKRSGDLLNAKGGEFFYTPMSRAKHLYILQDIKRITAKLGYSLKWPIDKEKLWWDLPHLGYLAARREGKGYPFFWEIHRARWGEGKNICSREVIREIASKVGLDPEGIENAPDDEAIRSQGAEELYKCYEEGVFGIPFFVHGYEKFWGIDRFEDFVASLKRQEEISTCGKKEGIRVDEELTHTVYDTDHAGGCG